MTDELSKCIKKHQKAAADTLECVFLVLDKYAQPIPWESIPCLRSKPVCRLPSLQFLPANSFPSISSSKVYYLLNPSGDLHHTQSWFEPLVKRYLSEWCTSSLSLLHNNVLSSDF